MFIDEKARDMPKISKLCTESVQLACPSI